MSKTFYWHDYETWGVNPALDRPSQFAGVRTDWDLNIIGEPLVIYNQPPLDRLPHPQACAITGITPQHAMQHGLNEPEFCAQIYQQMNQAGTCGVGYNSLRFDDEVTRYMLYRNFYPVYDREWKQGNSRWDLIDVMRLCYALRPENIEWPRREDGTPSFKLENLSKANGLLHEQAHDALSDVHATIALAKLLKEKKGKLFDYALALRDKHQVSKQLDIANRKPVLHISSYFSPAQGCASLIMPLAIHPTNKNAVIVCDLRQDPRQFLKADPQQVIDNLFTKADQRQFPVPLMSLQINRSPMLAPANLVDDKVCEHIKLDKQACWNNFQHIVDFDRSLLDMKLKAIYGSSNDNEDSSKNTSASEINSLAEQQLYGGGFFSSQDVAQLETVRDASADDWQQGLMNFQDPRLNELQQHYQARNFPKTLDLEFKQAWLDYSFNNVNQPASPKMLSIDAYLKSLDELEAASSSQETASQDKSALLKALRDWPAKRQQHLLNKYS